MPRVTARLRATWSDQRAQAVEEREFTQSGRRRSPEDVAIVDYDVAVMDRLLALPVGARFDAREVAREVAAERNAAAAAVGQSSVNETQDEAPADPFGPSGHRGMPRERLLAWTDGDAALLAAECERYGLPENAGLDGLLRHVYANRDLAHEVNMRTIERARERREALVTERDALRSLLADVVADLRGQGLDRYGEHLAGQVASISSAP